MSKQISIKLNLLDEKRFNELKAYKGIQSDSDTFRLILKELYDMNFPDETEASKQRVSPVSLRRD